MELRSRTTKEEKSTEDYDFINVSSDGNCLFRCIAIYLSKDLTNCDRSISGVAKNKRLQSQEIAYSRSLRFFVTNYIERNKINFKDFVDYDPEYYDDIDDRLNHMKKPGEFGGMLEIKIISKLLDINIKVFVNNNDNLNMVSSFKSNSKLEYCNLLLDDDHYLLINTDIQRSNNNESIITNKSIYYYPNFNKNDNKCIPYICQDYSETKGILIQTLDDEFDEELKRISTFNGKVVANKINIGWFFWDNFKEIYSWSKENNILWLI